MTEAMVLQILESRSVKQQGLRSALGLRRVGKRYGPDKTESACKLALGFGAKSYKPVARILKLGRETPPEASKARTPIEHENVRGHEYFN